MSKDLKRTFSIGIIGCGRPLRTEGSTGFGMSHRHMAGFKETGRCSLAAVADISRENAEAFVAEHNPDAAIHADYREMMEQSSPDIVSICLWPHLHAEVVEAIAPFKPRIIFCEKPMDIHWDAALRMHEVCAEHGVLLAFNHQRRFNLPFAKARELLDAGEIGELTRLEGAWANLSDAGTHVLDMLFFFNNDNDAEWVMGQIDMRKTTRIFGAVQAGAGIAEFRFKNGVRATYRFGPDHAELGALIHLTGTKGDMEILFEEPWLRIRRYGQAEWENLDTGESIHDDKGIYRAIAEVVSCLESGARSQLASENALRATEIIFATEESMRRRGRVELPLPPMKSPVLEMLASGEIVPEIEDHKF